MVGQSPESAWTESYVPRHEVASVQQLTFEIVLHPCSRGDRLLKPIRFAPLGLWYRDLEPAISYAAWAAREADRVEIRALNRGRHLGRAPDRRRNCAVKEAHGKF